MSENIALRLTIDAYLFVEESPSLKSFAKTLIREGKGDLGVGEKLAREFMDKVKRGTIEIDDLRNVEDHS